MSLELFALAVALAMDATAAAATCGLTARCVRARDVARVTLAFGGAQRRCRSSVAPRAGAEPRRHHLGPLDRVRAPPGIGAHMLVEARSQDDPGAAEGNDPFATGTLCWLALATSIDALAAGVTLPLLGVPLLVSVAVIGTTTAVLSGAGLLLGRRVGHLLGRA
jgi:putative Mn2+ efflux pump MntP